MVIKCHGISEVKKATEGAKLDGKAAKASGEPRRTLVPNTVIFPRYHVLET